MSYHRKNTKIISSHKVVDMMCHRKNLRENNTNDTDKQILIGYIKKNSKVLGNSSPYRWKNIEELDNCKHACGFAYNVTINKKLHKYLMLFLSRKPLSIFELYHFFHWKCEWIEKNQIVLPTTFAKFLCLLGNITN